MAIYHCSVKIGSRGKGQSAIAAAAYRSGSKLIDKEIGVILDYTRKGGVVFSEISLCQNAPAEYADREVLWNSVHKIEKTKDAQLWREIEVALPKELDRAEQIETVREYVKGLTAQGMCADWSLHDKGEVNGNIDLTGNINITSGIKALNDVNLGGNVENTQDSVICSKTGDITINTDNLNLNGLVYAPNGSVNITAQNLNLNSVIIIADTITITCPNLNANYNAQMAEFIGNESEPVIHNEDDDTELEIVAYSDYDDEDEKFTIYWNTTVPNGTFDILSSDDGENYTSIGTVIDDDS